MNLSAVGVAGLLFLLFFGLFLPIAAYRGRHRLTSMRPQPTRLQLYRSLVLQLALFLGLGLLAAWQEGGALWRCPDAWRLPLLAILLLLGALTLVTAPVRRRAVERREPRVYFAMPVRRDEMAWWIAVSVLAGVAEEYVYRGVFTDLMIRLTGSLTLAWVTAILAFSIAHAAQGSFAAVAFSALFSLIAHIFVLATGTLLFAMLLHALYDVIAGFEYRRLGLQLGYPEHGLPDADSGTPVTTSPGASSP